MKIQPNRFNAANPCQQFKTNYINKVTCHCAYITNGNSNQAIVYSTSAHLPSS